jgi:hypothetical protein
MNRRLQQTVIVNLERIIFSGKATGGIHSTGALTSKAIILKPCNPKKAN